MAQPSGVVVSRARCRRRANYVWLGICLHAPRSDANCQMMGSSVAGPRFEPAGPRQTANGLTFGLDFCRQARIAVAEAGRAKSR